MNLKIIWHHDTATTPTDKAQFQKVDTPAILPGVPAQPAPWPLSGERQPTQRCVQRLPTDLHEQGIKDKSAMMKATDIKTSRKLERLGLDTATSDVHWESDNKRLTHKLCIGKAKAKHCTPAWTLAALLAVMPESIRVGNEVYVQVMRKWYDTEQECESYEFSYEDADGIIPSNADYDNTDPTAAAAAMVEWLLSDGHIK